MSCRQNRCRERKSNNCCGGYYPPVPPVAASYGMDDAPAQVLASNQAIVFGGANAPVVSGDVSANNAGFTISQPGTYNVDFNVELSANTQVGLNAAIQLRYRNLANTVIYSRLISVPYNAAGQYVLGTFIFRAIEAGTLELLNVSSYQSGGLQIPTTLNINRAQFRINRIGAV